jgi:integrase
MTVPKLKRFKKSASGQGSIVDKTITRPDGSTYIRWEGYLSLGKDGNGKRKRTVVYGASQAEVVEKLAALQQRVRTGTHSEEKRTLGQYLNDWLKHKELEIKPRSLEFYRHYAQHHIVKELGGVKLQKLNTQQVRNFLASIHKSVSADCANKCRTTLNIALNQAVRDAVIARNPVIAVSPFKLEAKAKEIEWSSSEVFLFLSTARTHRLYAAFYLALSTGMRHGEVLGLRWCDIQGDTLHVTQTVVKGGGGYAFSTPKTAHGARRVTLDPETVATLEEHRLKQRSEAKDLGDDWQEEKHFGLVFTSEAGTPIIPRNFDRTWYLLQDATKKAYVDLGVTDEEKNVRAKQIAEEKVLPHIRFHDLRHMHVSLLNKAGVDARTIADRIGHTDPAFTLKRYAHVFEDQRKAAAIPLLRLLSPPKGEPT